MFIGHFAAGMAAKKIQPTLSLGILFLAAQFLDLLWPALLLLGIEHVIISPGISKVTPLDFVDYPISHSLLVVIIWSLLFGIWIFSFHKKSNWCPPFKRSGTQPLGTGCHRSHSRFAAISWTLSESGARTVELAFPHHTDRRCHFHSRYCSICKN